MENRNELKIVVVDDSDFSRKGIIEILDDAGYNVVGEANSAESAMQIIHNSNCNLVITDVVMPEIGGIDLARTINEKFKDKTVIMISSLATQNIVIEAISNGAVDFLQKPFDKEELLKSVRKIETQLNSE